MARLMGLSASRRGSGFDQDEGGLFPTLPSTGELFFREVGCPMTIPLSYYVILSAVVFLTGVVGVLIRRNIIAILLSVELMLNATNINFVAFSRYLEDVGGQVFVFFALTVAAAEVAVGLAIIIALHRSKESINVEDFKLLKW